MALQTHPDTGIVFDDVTPHGPGTDRFVHIEAYDLATFNVNNKATYRPLHQNANWGRSDGAPISGMGERFMYFKKLPRQTVVIDHRYTKSTLPVMLLTDPAPPAGYPVGTYQEIEEAVLLPEADLKAQVDTAFQREIARRFPQVADPAVLIMGGGAIARKSDGATLTTDQTASVEAVKSLEDVIRQLDARRLEMYAAIEAEENYDIENWAVAE
jgi:hypothetical protein